MKIPTTPPPHFAIAPRREAPKLNENKTDSVVRFVIFFLFVLPSVLVCECECVCLQVHAMCKSECKRVGMTVWPKGTISCLVSWCCCCVVLTALDPNEEDGRNTQRQQQQQTINTKRRHWAKTQKKHPKPRWLCGK